MITAKTHKSSLVKIIRGKKIRIERVTPGAVHLDGEPMELSTVLEIEIIPASLKVIV